MTENKHRTRTEVYLHRYTAGCNQHRVDIREISQKEADKILQKTLKE